ncbi:MAG: TlyA family RNA methyltransferase [Bdellovibrionales bacterium]|nr:TlyA family RNA methyltransferase [Bdellovibrionales bacterium]
MAKSKLRLDKLLLERGLVETRSKAEALIRTGVVLVNDSPIDKPGVQVSSDVQIRLKGAQSPYVGRGGEKLAGALDAFGLSVEGCVVLDVGSSTGGFTDCMLQRGAVKSYAVDVGTNQLDYKLRSDERVVVMEQQNAKALSPDMFEDAPQFAAIDVSFIGLTKVLKPVVGVLQRPFVILAMVKPQFELAPEYVSKGGVVKDAQLQLKAVKQVQDYAIGLGLEVSEAEPAVIRGNKKGNQEYFICIRGS